MFHGLPTILTFSPLVGVLLLLLMRGFKRDNDTNVRIVAVATTVVVFVISLVMLGTFRAAGPGITELQMVDRANWINMINVDYYLAVDGLSILMVLLTSFITMLAVAASWNSVDHNPVQYFVFMLLLETGMLGVFLAQEVEGLGPQAQAVGVAWGPCQQRLGGVRRQLERQFVAEPGRKHLAVRPPATPAKHIL